MEKFKGNFNCLYTYDSILFGGGSLFSPFNHIAQWNGTKWDSVGTSGTSNYAVRALAADSGMLYAGGQFDSVGGQSASKIARWDGKNWYAMDSGMNNWVSTIAIYQGTIYAGGWFTKAGSYTVNHIAMWGKPNGINEIKNTAKMVNVYPNPNDGRFNLDYIMNPTDNGQMIVYNLMGQEVIRYNLNPNKTTLQNSTSLNDGIYFYRILINGKPVATNKFVVIRNE